MASLLRELAAAPSGELGRLIDRLGVDQVLSRVGRRRAGFLKLVAGDRLPEVTVPQRCQIITWMQRGWTSTNEENAVARILLNTRGADLQRLRDLIDLGADHYDLMHLIFDDIDDRTLRDKLLQHISHESAELPRRLRPISDIDDTLYPSINDRRFPKGQLYPGVLQLHRELLLGLPQRMVFLTARPEGRFGLIEDATHRQLLRKNVVESTILSGTFRALRSKLAMARAKERNFERYTLLFPEDDFLFIGDSGQGDPYFGRDMLQRSRGRLKRVLIHQLDERRPIPECDRLSYFTSYPEAAEILERDGFLKAGAAERCAAHLNTSATS